jgi:uncharacterized repeat protein (TIGR01451 family)
MKSVIRHPAALVCALVLFPAFASAATVRDDFSSRSWSNNDGTANWSGNWIEVDGDSIGPTSGNVWITTGGELRLEDRPNTGGQPSAAREVNLLGATSATLTFDWRTTGGVDFSDSVVLEVSADGGSTWTTLQNYTGLVGSNSGTGNFDLVPYAGSNTRLRFRVNNLYGGGGESFRLDFVEIDYQVVLSGTDLTVSQTDTPDPVNVGANMSYTLNVTNAGPDDATGVTVTDTLPAGAVFQSASATQGSCAHVSGVVTCLLGDLTSGSNATVNIALTAPIVTGAITNSASVSGNETDPIAANNTDAETTIVQNLNVNQLCYLVADSGGGNGGNDLFTTIDTADFNPATNETSIGSGTGTNAIEAIAFNSATGVVFAADANRLGTLNATSGLFEALPQTFGAGSGAIGNVTFSDVDGLTYDASTGVLYGSHRRGGSDLLIQINMATGAHVPNAFGAGIDYVPIQPVLFNALVDDIAVDPTTGIMYAVVNSGGSTDRLIRINKSTGATTDIALITVPDIEGLGTDPSGQLWGTSGTQGILYEIDKLTGTGSNGRAIDNGGDYESVDCFAFSPSITADLGLLKTVDDPSPSEGDVVSYTVTVTNAGPGPATVIQVADLLPAGVTLVSALPGQGTYDALAGDWFVGSLAAGSSAALTLNASVDSGSGGSTITNTATIDFLSQVDPNVANDSASVAITPVGSPSLIVLKAAATLDDPINGTSSPMPIPGATIRYQIVITNTGAGTVDTDSLIITDPLPANMSFVVANYDGSTAGPLRFENGSPASGLSYSFAALDDTGDDIDFSDDGGVTFDYEPVADANGVDPAVTNIRVNPKGQFAASGGGGDPSAQFLIKLVVQ